MKQCASLSRQRGRGVVGTIVLALVLGAALIGGLYWWSSRPAGTSSSTATGAAATPDAATAAAPVGDPAERAEIAMQQKQMFVPPGANAFELYLQVVDADPDNVQARNALGDLFPYAVLYVEQRIAAGDVADGQRVLALMQRADPAAPALPRLASTLTDLGSRQAQQLAETERRTAEAAARTSAAALATQEAAATAAPEATPAATPPPVAAAPAPAPVVEPAPQEPAPVAAAPAAAPVAATPAPVGTGALPAVISRVDPRYPIMAARRRIEGHVEVQFTVQPDGSVTDVSVVSSRPKGTFEREAIAAMERWRFAPQATATRGRRAFDFKLD